jgi:hypothetical protein
VGVGYVQVSKSEEMRARFGAAKNEPTFMIFKENISVPHLLLQVILPLFDVFIHRLKLVFINNFGQ